LIGKIKKNAPNPMLLFAPTTFDKRDPKRKKNGEEPNHSMIKNPFDISLSCYFHILAFRYLVIFPVKTDYTSKIRILFLFLGRKGTEQKVPRMRSSLMNLTCMCGWICIDRSTF
jgi:hypothetical protein